MMQGTLVCETVTAEALGALVARRDAVTHADLVELRLDGVADLDVEGALYGRTRPVVVTCRPAWEGGRFTGGEEERVALLNRAVAAGAEYVDVEWRADRGRLQRREGTAIVLSHHVLDGTPRDLPDRVRAMRAESPDVLKVVVTPASLGDCLTLRDATRGEDRHVAIGLGAVGLISRVHPALFGSCWTYAGSTAPGQLPARTLTEQYRVRETGPATSLYGVVGSPLAHSASPAMHNAAFRALGFDAVYAPLESGDADEVLSFAEAVGARGLSVTAPLKLALCQRASSTDDVCARTGAANTLAWRAGRLEARNFDVEGFMAPMRSRGVELKGRPAVVLGAGGAARAAAWGLAAAGARVSIAARRPVAAEALAATLGLGVVAWPPAGRWDVLVNATPVGTWPALTESPLPAAALHAGGLVYDLVYNPRRTRLLDDAQAAGLETIGGIEMLVAQAVSQCRWWTGQAAPPAVLADAAARFLSEMQESNP